MASCKCAMCNSSRGSPLPKPTERTEQAMRTEEIIEPTENDIEETTDYGNVRIVSMILSLLY